MPLQRYNSVAISLHWLIAFLLLGLVVLGKVMNSLDADDPFRFDLIQWHKSFGILVLLLVILRLLWRLTHRPPSLPVSIKKIERFGAGGAHLVLYVLMLAIPLSGWFMVSSSPLNLKTELFGTIAWPHVTWFETVPDKEAVTAQLVDIHHWLVQGLVIMVVLHLAAALRHRFILKDNVMSRMMLSATEHGADKNHGLLPGALLILAGGLYLFNAVENTSTAALVSGTAPQQSGGDDTQPMLAAGSVGFTVLQLGEPVIAVFEDVDLKLSLDIANPGSSVLSAKVQTASVNSGDGQLDATVVTDDWFASDEFPSATFISTAFGAAGDNNFNVSGELTIREITQPITFILSLSGGIGAGELVIDRTLFGVGVGGQDEFVDPEVTIRFKVPNQIR